MTVRFPGRRIFCYTKPARQNPQRLFPSVSIVPQSRRALLAFLHDVGMAALSFALALYLRLGDDILQYEPRLTLIYGAAFTAIAAIIFLVTGLYRGIWRYASLPDLFNIARAATLTVLIFLLVMFVFTRLEGLPRSTLLIDWLVLIALLGGPRLGYRLFKGRGLDHIVERSPGQNVPGLLISPKGGPPTLTPAAAPARAAVFPPPRLLSR